MQKKTEIVTTRMTPADMKAITPMEKMPGLIDAELKKDACGG